MGKTFEKYKYLIYAGTTIIGIVLSLLISAVPGAVYVPSLDTSPSSTKVAIPVAGYYGNWLEMNSSTPIDAGLPVTGNITLPKYGGQVSSYSPTMYVLSPSDYSAWVNAHGQSNPSSSVTAQTDVVYDFGNQILWMTFSFKTTSTAYFYFLVSGNFNGYPGYGTVPSLNVAVHKSSVSLANTVSTLLVGVPSALILVAEVYTRWKGKPKRFKKQKP